MGTHRQTVLIMTDTQLTRMVGCYPEAPDFIRTPHLDALAAGGVRFDKAYTCQPVCGPARAAIFTGTCPHTNGSWGNSMPLGQTIKSVGERLQDQGVLTGYIGKWHLDAGDYYGDGVCPPGWDPATWYDMRNYLDELTPEERVFSRDCSNAGKVDAAFTFAHRCSNRALEFIRQHQHEDFLLVVSYDEPHHPWLCPAEYMDMYEGVEWPLRENAFDTLADKPEHQKAWSGRWSPEAVKANPPEPFSPQRFLACNSFVDHEIGRVLAGLDAVAPEALVMYTADHGDGMGSHGLHNKGAVMYEEIVRIPLIARQRGVTPAGGVCAHPVSHIDLTPTILASFGAPVVPFLEGQSLLPACGDPAVRVNQDVFIEFGRYEIDHDTFGGFQPIRCITDGRYKLVINLLCTDEFYDLDTDPGELRNRIEDSSVAAIRDALHDRLLAWMNDTRDPFRGYYWHRRPWRTDAPAAAWGYGGYTRQRPDDGYHPVQRDYDNGLDIVEWVRRK